MALVATLHLVAAAAQGGARQPSRRPAPPTKKAAPAPAPAPKKFTLKAGVLFDFDKATLTAQGKSDLDILYSDIQAANPQDKAITVVGYTDRMGSEAYNQKLSQARAQTVADYLNGKGIAGNIIKAEGRGESDPVTGNTCDKVKPRAKLINCLEPDRRVELLVTGLIPVKK